MNFFRWMLGLPLAAAVTLGLFIMMTALIAQDSRTDPPRDPGDLSILAKIIETQPTPIKPPKVNPDDAPPPPETKWEKTTERVGPVINLPPGGVVVDPPKAGDGARPIITLAPQYPEACRARGAQGVVLVQYDVTARGEVTNVRILSSDNSCFDRTVIKTIMGWKYPPEARRGVIQRFVFSLNDAG